MVRCRMSQLADLPSRVASCTTGTRPGGANLGIDLAFWENTGRLVLVQQHATTVLPGDDLFAPKRFWVLETVCIIYVCSHDPWRICRCQDLSLMLPQMSLMFLKTGYDSIQYSWKWLGSGFWVSHNDRILMVISYQLHPRFWIDYDSQKVHFLCVKGHRFFLRIACWRNHNACWWVLWFVQSEIWVAKSALNMRHFSAVFFCLKNRLPRVPHSIRRHNHFWCISNGRIAISFFWITPILTITLRHRRGEVAT